MIRPRIPVVRSMNDFGSQGAECEYFAVNRALYHQSRAELKDPRERRGPKSNEAIEPGQLRPDK